jgi:hypothetical protein
VLKPFGHPLILPCMFIMIFFPCWVWHVLTLFIYCIYTTWIAAQTRRLLMSTRRMCHQSVACWVPFWRSAASCSLWWHDYKTFGHVMVMILSFTLWHCIWYSLSHYVCVTWSWCICNLCIWVCLQIRVWQLRTRRYASSPYWCLHHGRRARTSSLGRKTRWGFCK